MQQCLFSQSHQLLADDEQVDQHCHNLTNSCESGWSGPATCSTNHRCSHLHRSSGHQQRASFQINKGLSPNPNKITIIIPLSGGWYRDVHHFSAPQGDVPSIDSFARRATSKLPVIQARHLPRPSTCYKPEHTIVDRFDLAIFEYSMNASCIPVVWSTATSTFTSTFTNISICTASIDMQWFNS